MQATVGVGELRQNLSKHLKRVAAGERIVVTDRNRPVATLGPPPDEKRTLDELIAEGKASPGRRQPGDPFPEPLPWNGDPYAATKALQYLRGDR